MSKQTEKEKTIQYAKDLRERRELMEQIQQAVINGDCESQLL